MHVNHSKEGVATVPVSLSEGGLTSVLVSTSERGIVSTAVSPTEGGVASGIFTPSKGGVSKLCYIFQMTILNYTLYTCNFHYLKFFCHPWCAHHINTSPLINSIPS